MHFKNNRFARVAAIAAVIWTALLTFALVPGNAQASGCRTDPIVVLSNGAQLQMAASLSTSYTNVQSVIYKIHAPVGSAVVLVIYTDNPLGSVERVQFYADAPANHYSTETIAYTAYRGTTVTASSALVNLLHLTLASGSATGLDRQYLPISLNPQR
jgi:hypothetical protein